MFFKSLIPTLALVAALGLCFHSSVVGAAKKPSSNKSGSSKTQTAKSTKSSVKSSKKTSTVRRRAPRRRWSRVSSRRSRGQQSPTPERYREIQQALADKGFFRDTPDGEWGPSSVEALKEFQQANNLPPTGKLDALSIIVMGLGPKRDAPAPSSTTIAGAHE